MRVLIADDDKVLNLLLAGLFKQQGWDVVSALDAMQAVMMAMRTPPDVIIMDIQMPGGTGMHALRKLKGSAKTAQIPVVVLSGSVSEAEVQETLALGAAEFLRKPADPDVVFAAATRLARAPS